MNAHEKWPELPANPKNWKKKMQMHLNFGPEGGAATYTIHDPDDMQMPIYYQYDTRKGGLTGFTMSDKEGAMTWKELVAYWPEYVKSKQAKAA